MKKKKCYISRCNQGGMLVSVLLSMGIMLIVLVVSIPLFRQYQPNMRLAAAAREMTTNLRYSQQQTIAEQVPYWVEFSPMLHNYRILKTGPATTTIKVVDLPADVEFHSITGLTDDRVVYNAYGAAAESGEIVLYNINGQTRTVSVKLSGYVQLSQ